jgi:hypothetical protein
MGSFLSFLSPDAPTPPAAPPPPTEQEAEAAAARERVSARRRRGRRATILAGGLPETTGVGVGQTATGAGTLRTAGAAPLG